MTHSKSLMLHFSNAIYLTGSWAWSESSKSIWLPWRRCEGATFHFQAGWSQLSSINNLLQHHHHTIPFQVIFGDISNKSWFKFNFLNLRQLQLSGDKVGQCSILDRQTVHFTIINILTSKYVKLGVCKNIKSIFFFVNGKKLKSICRKRKQTETRQTDDTSDVKKTEKFKSKPHTTFYRFEWMNVCPKTSTANDACAVCIFSPNLSHWSQTILA